MTLSVLAALLVLASWWTHRGPPDGPTGTAPLTHTNDEPTKAHIPNIPQHLKGDFLNG